MEPWKLRNLEESNMSDAVNIRALKGIALRLDDPIKTLILSEPDTLPREEYLIKVVEWLKIIDFSRKDRSP